MISTFSHCYAFDVYFTLHDIKTLFEGNFDEEIYQLNLKDNNV